MMISTKGRYALRVMLDLAGRMESGYIPLAEIAALAVTLYYWRKVYKNEIQPIFAEQAAQAGAEG